MTEDQVQAALEGARWKFARTMPGIPHWYTLRDQWTAERSFEGVVQYIRDWGYLETFGKKVFTRINFGAWKYWSMGSPLAETILINRALLPGYRYPTKAEIEALKLDPYLPFEVERWSR